jgi:metal-dependent amidase/aminoacylase/carboxypeptidase family protein
VTGFANAAAGWASASVLGTVTYARIGCAETGSNFGITPGEAQVTGVLRAQKTADLARLRGELEALSGQLAAASGLGHGVSWHEEFAATGSDADSVAVVRDAAKSLGLALHPMEEPFRWSEDFGRFTDRFPGAFFGLGSGLEQPQLHDDCYDYPDELIETGARVFRAIVDRHLGG